MAVVGASRRARGHTIGPISDRPAFTIFGFPVTIAPGFLLGLLLLAGLNLQDPSFALGLVGAVAAFTARARARPRAGRPPIRCRIGDLAQLPRRVGVVPADAPVAPK